MLEWKLSSRYNYLKSLEPQKRLGYNKEWKDSVNRNTERIKGIFIKQLEDALLVEIKAYDEYSKQSNTKDALKMYKLAADLRLANFEWLLQEDGEFYEQDKAANSRDLEVIQKNDDEFYGQADVRGKTTEFDDLVKSVAAAVSKGAMGTGTTFYSSF